MSELDGQTLSDRQVFQTRGGGIILFPLMLLYICVLDGIIGLVKQIFLHKIVFYFFYISLNMCFGCSKEHGSSFEYQQHTFWLRNNKKNHLITCSM